jgi:protease I
MTNLSEKRVAIIATDGFEQSELESPKHELESDGAQVDVISLKAGTIRGWDMKDWGQPVAVDRTIDDARPENYDALVLPGGVMNPDKLRRDPRVLRFVGAMAMAKKPIAAICHGPWTLIDAGLVKGRRMTSYPSLQTDLKNAGADWVDEEVVRDSGIITSRNPNDLPAFNKALVKEIKEGVHAHSSG